MSAAKPDADGASTAGQAPADEEARQEREVLSYQGFTVPFFVVLIWAAFLIWGLIYLLHWIPESWREWFSR